MHSRLAGWLGCIAVVACAGCESSRGSAVESPAEGPTIEVRRGAVVCVSIDASRVGRDVMRRGGNAVDAAVATAFALAVKLAKEGFELNKDMAEGLNEYLAKPGDEAKEMRRVLAKPGGKWAAGDRLVQAELAETLKHIAEEGASAFYEGAIADAIVESLDGGLIAQADLS